MASSDPNPSSQTRVGVTKYAAAGSVGVSSTDLARDAAVTTDQTRGAPHVRPAAAPEERTAAAMSTGQKQVELLLHRQRPVVLHRAGRVLGGEVVGGRRGQGPVLDVQRRGDRLAGHAGDQRSKAARRSTPRGSTPSTRDAAGSRRRTRRAQNAARAAVAVVGGDRSRWLEMRKPEMTKNTSTPT